VPREGRRVPVAYLAQRAVECLPRAFGAEVPVREEHAPVDTDAHVRRWGASTRPQVFAAAIGSP
jgi:hypothetical protein